VKISERAEVILDEPCHRNSRDRSAIISASGPELTRLITNASNFINPYNTALELEEPNGSIDQPTRVVTLKVSLRKRWPWVICEAIPYAVGQACG
jgi:hypothetical protein